MSEVDGNQINLFYEYINVLNKSIVNKVMQEAERQLDATQGKMPLRCVFFRLFQKDLLKSLIGS